MSEDTRSRIIVAAATLFCCHGYKQTTLRMIGEQVDITHVSVLRYFKNKNELAAQVIYNYIAGLETLCYHFLEEVPAELADSESYRHMIWWTLHYRILSQNPTFREFYIAFWSEGQTAVARESKSFTPKTLQFIQIAPPIEEDLIYWSLFTALDATFARLVGMQALGSVKATKLMIQQLNKLNFDMPYLPNEDEISDFERAYLPERNIDLLNEILLANILS